MRPYVSVDIETTGIDDDSHILQIAAVYDDLKTPINELPKFNHAIKYEKLTHCEPYALGMNAELLKKMMNKDFPTSSPHDSCVAFLNWLLSLGFNTKDRTLFAGKNVASFDIPKLKLHFYKHSRGLNFDDLIHYKTLDVGSLYFDTFGDIR